jgi:hypothetical protein
MIPRLLSRGEPIVDELQEVRMNRFIRVLTFMVSAWLASVMAPASAANDCGPSANLPAGSYRQSCSVCEVSGADLTATCQTMRNSANRSTLFNFQTCRSGIENFDGYLTCHKGDGQAPGGSYTQSCRNVNVEKGVLYADCRKVNGQWKTASLPLGRCSYEVYNSDGALACTVPYGTYLRSCRNAHVSNGQLQAECKTAGGQWRFAQIAAVCNRPDLSNIDGVLKCQ